MTYASLFEKFQKHEIEFGRLEKHEKQEKKSKDIVLKVDSIEEQEEDAPKEDENFILANKDIVCVS